MQPAGKDIHVGYGCRVFLMFEFNDPDGPDGPDGRPSPGIALLAKVVVQVLAPISSHHQ